MGIKNLSFFVLELKLKFWDYPLTLVFYTLTYILECIFGYTETSFMRKNNEHLNFITTDLSIWIKSFIKMKVKNPVSCAKFKIKQI